MPFEKINDLQIYYEVHGEGEVVILMHHGFGSTRMWDCIYPSFVAKGYKVVMYDRRGFGRSERGMDFQKFYESDRYRLESMEELRTIKERLGIQECHIVGQCEAGVIGVYYSIRYPLEVKTLTLGSTQCYSDIPMTDFAASKFGTKFADLKANKKARIVKWHGGAAEVNYNQFISGGGAYGMNYFDLRPILPIVPCPALVLYPDSSAIFEVEQAIALYRNLSKGELAVFPKCGHDTYEERPEDYIRTILDFIKRNTEHEGPDY